MRARVELHETAIVTLRTQGPAPDYFHDRSAFDGSH